MEMKIKKLKNNINMVRKMGEFDVIQRTKDGYFDANDLLRQWNQNKKAKREIKKFLDSPKTKQFIEKIRLRESPIAEMRLGDFQVVKTVKGRNTKRGRTYDKIWMHPYLYLDFAMWVNPDFKYDVIKFIYDQLINYRHLSGDSYKQLMSYYQSHYINKFNKIPTPEEYAAIARFIKEKVFGANYKSRNKNWEDKVTEYELMLRNEVELAMIQCIKKGYNKKEMVEFVDNTIEMFKMKRNV